VLPARSGPKEEKTVTELDKWLIIEEGPFYEFLKRTPFSTLSEDDGNSQNYLRNQGTWTKLLWDDGAKKLTISAAPPAGVTNESTAPREFRVEMLPAGTVKTVTYNGRQTEVAY
jgi:hypothetical protein